MKQDKRARAQVSPLLSIFEVSKRVWTPHERAALLGRFGMRLAQFYFAHGACYEVRFDDANLVARQTEGAEVQAIRAGPRLEDHFFVLETHDLARINVPFALTQALEALGDDDPLVIHHRALAHIIADWPEVIGRPIPMSLSA